jgi:hypothetical protein
LSSRSRVNPTSPGERLEGVIAYRAQQRIVAQLPGLWQSSGSAESWPLLHSLLLHQPSELQLNMQVEPFATT